MKIILSYIMATIILLFLLALPIAGVVAYIRLIRKMRREQITAIPKFSLFMLFLICGTLLMEILLGISGMWSEHRQRDSYSCCSLLPPCVE